MIDFRYHALSLVAVFLALGIGIVLGVTIGDELVSETDRRLREDLRTDVLEARESARREQQLGGIREEVIGSLAAEAMGNRLGTRRVAVVALGELPGEVVDDVEEALELGGGRIASQSTFAVPDELDDLARALRRPLVATPDEARRLGSILGRAVIRGGRPLRRVRADLPRRFSGDYGRPPQNVVLYRHPPGDEDAEEAQLREEFDAGLADALRRPVIGVELLDTEPSQVPFYDDVAVASVDALDLRAGQLAVALVLAEGAQGRFGFKDSADRALPDRRAR